MISSPRSRPVLVLGATGTTGSRVASLLQDEGHPVRGASRSSAPAFVWDDPATYDAVLADVRAVYLLPPVGVLDPEPAMRGFVERALARGIRRIVLLSAALAPEGSPGVGSVHALLRARAPEWAVLQPSWFMQNFERGHYMAEDLASGRLTSSVGDGRVAFVDADDIAAVAVRALVDREPHQAAHVITGPEALSYDDVAATLAPVVGRDVVHQRVDGDAVRARMRAAGIPPAFAEVLAGLEDQLRDGADDRVTDTVQRVAGRPPTSLADWARRHLDPTRSAA